MKRGDGRTARDLRPVRITTRCNKHAEGSCLIRCGDTEVLCTATVEETVPSFLKGSGRGWVTAEYGMLPRSCTTRIKRNAPSGRMCEIQRLIGRSLRAVMDFEALGERTIKIDCDVLQADGGTRTASVTGGFVALVSALRRLRRTGCLAVLPLRDAVAAVSVGIVDGCPLLDLCYDEDARAEVDMNVVMTGAGRFVEIQGTGEGATFSRRQIDVLLRLAAEGIGRLIDRQRAALRGLRIPGGRAA